MQAHVVKLTERATEHITARLHGQTPGVRIDVQTVCDVRRLWIDTAALVIANCSSQGLGTLRDTNRTGSRGR